MRPTEGSLLDSRFCVSVCMNSGYCIVIQGAHIRYSIFFTERCTHLCGLWTDESPKSTQVSDFLAVAVSWYGFNSRLTS
jgi:hypothetical protein